MKYEVSPDKTFPNDWRVEAIDSKTGDIFVTVFGVADAELRAKEYAAWKESTWTIGDTMETLLGGWEHLPLSTQKHISVAIKKAYELGQKSKE